MEVVGPTAWERLPNYLISSLQKKLKKRYIAQCIGPSTNGANLQLQAISD